MFGSSSMLDECQRNRPHTIDGKTVETKRATPRSEMPGGRRGDSSQPSKRIFVANLTDDIEDRDLEQYFSRNYF